MMTSQTATTSISHPCGDSTGGWWADSSTDSHPQKKERSPATKLPLPRFVGNNPPCYSQQQYPSDSGLGNDNRHGSVFDNRLLSWSMSYTEQQKQNSSKTYTTRGSNGRKDEDVCSGSADKQTTTTTSSSGRVLLRPLELQPREELRNVAALSTLPLPSSSASGIHVHQHEHVLCTQPSNANNKQHLPVVYHYFVESGVGDAFSSTPTSPVSSSSSRGSFITSPLTQTAPSSNPVERYLSPRSSSIPPLDGDGETSPSSLQSASILLTSGVATFVEGVLSPQPSSLAPMSHVPTKSASGSACCNQMMSIEQHTPSGVLQHNSSSFCAKPPSVCRERHHHPYINHNLNDAHEDEDDEPVRLVELTTTNNAATRPANGGGGNAAPHLVKFRARQVDHAVPLPSIDATIKVNNNIAHQVSIPSPQPAQHQSNVHERRKTPTLMKPPPVSTPVFIKKKILVLGLGGVLMLAENSKVRSSAHHAASYGPTRTPDAEIFVGSDKPSNATNTPASVKNETIPNKKAITPSTTINTSKSTSVTETINVYYRPHIAYFIANVLQHFDIAIFSTGEQDYVDALLDVMDPSGQVFPKSRRYYRQHCTKVFSRVEDVKAPSPATSLAKDLQIRPTSAAVFSRREDVNTQPTQPETFLANGTVPCALAKDLGILGRQMDEVILVDNTASSGVLQPNNLMMIPTWLGDPNDTGLLHLANNLDCIVLSTSRRT